MKRISKIGFYYLSRWFILEIAMHFDKYTLDFPVFFLHAGMQKVVWLQQTTHPQTGEATKLYYDCYGVRFAFQFWFFQFNASITPFTFRQKNNEA